MVTLRFYRRVCAGMERNMAFSVTGADLLKAAQSASNKKSAQASAVADDSGEELLAQAKQQAIAAKQAATKAAVDAIIANNAAIQEQALQARRAAEANARLTALGSNERIAALGLAGNAYQEPTSGFSETSRVRGDNAYQEALNSVGRDEITALRQNSSLAAQTEAKGASEQADLESEWSKTMAEWQRESEQAAYERQIAAAKLALQEADVTGYYKGSQTLAALQAAYEREIAARKIALQEGELTGSYNNSPTMSTLKAEYEGYNPVMSAEQVMTAVRQGRKSSKIAADFYYWFGYLPYSTN